MTGTGKPRSPGDLGSDPMRSGPIAGRFSNMNLGLTLLAVLAIGGFLLAQGLQPNVAAKPTSSTAPVEGTAAPVESAAGSPAGSPASSPAVLTPQPSTGLVGEFPGPDATIPPGAPPVISNLGIEAIAAAAVAEGLTCVSEAGTIQDGSGGYTLACEGLDTAGHAKFALRATYWTLGAISEIRLTAHSDTPGAVVSPAAPINLMSAISGVSSGQIAKTWVVGHLDDPACNPSCNSTYGDVLVQLQVGLNGARALHISAATP